jgi:hypothetical protein
MTVVATDQCSIRVVMREMSDGLTGLSRKSSAPSSMHLQKKWTEIQIVIMYH